MEVQQYPAVQDLKERWPALFCETQVNPVVVFLYLMLGLLCVPVERIFVRYTLQDYEVHHVKTVVLHYIYFRKVD